MKTIWKFPLEVQGMNRLEMPKGAKILSVQEQHDDPCIWAEVDTEAPKEARMFRLFGTGHELPDDLNNTGTYIGTFQLYDGALVFHLYEYTNHEHPAS